LNDNKSWGVFISLACPDAIPGPAGWPTIWRDENHFSKAVLSVTVSSSLLLFSGIRVNAGIFEKYALDAAAQIFKSNAVAVMVGGTGLYIKSFCEGIDAMPSISPDVRDRIIADYEKNGLEWLQEQVAAKDPIYWESTHEKNNPQRLMRALEMVLTTGKSITHFQSAQKVIRPFNILKIGLSMPREILNGRINDRVDAMMQDGLLEEVKALFPMAHLNALQTVGYQEIFAHLRGELSLQDAVLQIKQHTRQYAKRQMTWFKKDSQINWLELNTKS